jgi:hypothetical protein
MFIAEMLEIKKRADEIRRRLETETLTEEEERG